MHPKYEEDFYGWAMANAQLMRERKMSELDFENLIEEIESMGRREKHQLVSRLAVLLAHLLKWQYQPALQTRSWKLTIEEQREKIKDIFTENPSLKNKRQEAFLKAYEYSRYQAERETGILKTNFPLECPYTFEQCLDDNFYPASNS